MFKNLVFLFISIILISCNNKETPAFTISGKISPPTADYIILKKETDIERKVTEVIDTILVNPEGNFSLAFTNEPYLYSLNFPNKKKIDIALNAGQNVQLEISGYGYDNFKAIAKGSADTEALLDYEAFRKESLNRLVIAVRDTIKVLKKAEEPDVEKIAELGALELSNYEKHLAELNDYISTDMDSSLALYATSIRWKGQANIPLYDSLAKGLETKYPELELTKKLREKVTRLQQTSIGGIVKIIEMPDVAGETMSLSSITSEYILIDFWASWCPPCRREAPKLNELINTYSRDQFDIYGVSLDDKREKWLKALEKDNRTWTNVSTLERFKTPAAYDYAVTALPDNFLIDKNGKIIAKNIHGDELTSLLNKLITKRSN